MTIVDDLNREWREFRRFTGDGLPNPPVNAFLPVGDPQSGVHSPKKANIRNVLVSLAQDLLNGIATVNGAIPAINAARAAAIEDVEESRDESIAALHAQIDPLVDQAEAARDIAAGYASDAVSQGNVPIYATAVGIAALNIPDGINFIRTNGYYAPGDGGRADYRLRHALEASGDGDQASNGGSKRWAISTPSRNPRMYGAKGDGLHDDTFAIRAAFQSGLNVLFTQNEDGSETDHVVTQELELTKPGQVIRFLAPGGYGEGSNIGTAWKPNIRLIVKDDSWFTTTGKRIRTRRKYRASSADAQDDPISCVINVQAENVLLENVCVWLDCDYDNPSPTNYGTEVDVGIFIGCRYAGQYHNLQVIGYFRRNNVMLDVTQGASMPRFPDLNGIAYPSVDPQHGADRNHFWNPYLRGGLCGGFGIIGAAPKTGQTGYSTPYYDEVSGQTYTDNRGSSGASDFTVFGGVVSSPRHHSGQRIMEPTPAAGPLTLATMLAEPEFAPCAAHVDGITSNASGSIQSIRFIGTRIYSSEMFCVRLGYANRLMLSMTHMEGMSGVNYGYVSGTDKTGNVLAVGVPRNTVADDFASHFFGTTKPTALMDRGRLYLSDFLEFPTGPTITATSGTLRLATAAGANLRLGQGATELIVANATQFRPNADNAMSLASSSARWTTVYAATGSINTSDEREKLIQEVVEEAVLDAWGDVNWTQFQFRDAVERKGIDGARIHFGLVAQRVQEVFDRHGLDPFAFALLCYDEWEDEWEDIYDDDPENPEGMQVLIGSALFTPAGNRYGIRYDEALALEAAWQRREIQRLKDGLT